ncbi:hypothetical protein SNEBB_011411 [Seison nebaliae]|nr:hypothetical protein SNEBB_011411 [Seison nebaliae]
MRRQTCCSNRRNVRWLKRTARIIFPFMEWVPLYSLMDIIPELIAAVAVTLMMIPAGLAFSQIAGLPQQYGLYCSIVPGIIYVFFGSCKDLNIGATSIMSILTLSYATNIAPSAATAPQYAILLAFVTGIVQMLIAISSLGFLLNFIPLPVIRGFTTAAAITITVTQFKNFFGFLHFAEGFFPQIIYTFKHIKETSVADMCLGIFCVVLLVGLKFLSRQVAKWEKNNPLVISKCKSHGERSIIIARKFIWFLGIGKNALVVIFGAAIVVAITTMYPKVHFRIAGDVPSGLPSIKPPELNIYDQVSNKTTSFWHICGKISSGLIVVPLMGILEMLAIVKAFSRYETKLINTNREIFVTGLINCMGSFVGAYPITASFSRSAVQHQSGAKTPLTALLTSLFMIVALAGFTAPLKYIPTSSLAAVVIVNVLHMVDFDYPLKLMKQRSNKGNHTISSKLEFICWCVTFLVCLYELEYGILAGFTLVLLIMLYRLSRPRHLKVELIDTELVVYLQEKHLTFASIEYLSSTIMNKYVENVNGKDRSLITKNDDSPRLLFKNDCMEHAATSLLNNNVDIESTPRKETLQSANELIIDTKVMEDEIKKSNSDIDAITFECENIHILDSTTVQVLMQLVEQLLVLSSTQKKTDEKCLNIFFKNLSSIVEEQLLSCAMYKESTLMKEAIEFVKLPLNVGIDSADCTRTNTLSSRIQGYPNFRSESNTNMVPLSYGGIDESNSRQISDDNEEDFPWPGTH